jgi:hypothetical protein
VSLRGAVALGLAAFAATVLALLVPAAIAGTGSFA